MNEEERPRRPRLERSEPIRSFSTLVRGAGSSSPSPEGSPSAGDAFSRAVDVGYRVIDEYVRQGQQAAERMRKGTYDAQAATADVQDLAVRMARSASEMMETWLQLVAGVAGVAGRSDLGLDGAANLAGRAGASNGNGADVGHRWTDPPRPASPSSPTTSAPGSATRSSDPDESRLRIAVLSSRPTEVSVEIRSTAAGRPLRVHALRSVDPDLPRLEAKVEPGAHADDPPVLRVEVPADHPAGAYHGLVLDEEANRPLGTVTVRVLPPPDSSTP